MADDDKFITRFYPEYRAGGFTRCDGNVAFFVRVNALVRPDMTVLDYGAGRAEWFSAATCDVRQSLRLLKGKVARVVGADVEATVLTNPTVDEAFVVESDGRLDLDDASVDLVLADHTFEHIKEPAIFAREIDRVLKPGGWICARTPNRWGYIAVAARVVPYRFHASLLERVQEARYGEDVFETFYRMNTRSDLKSIFPPGRYRHAVYVHNPEPAYFGKSRALWRLMIVTTRFLPEEFGASLHIFLQKAE